MSVSSVPAVDRDIPERLSSGDRHDFKEREKALDPTQSFIVQAPAGSGKTELLIQRYLTLLTIVEKPEEILGITFTKKAANEMRIRITNALSQALGCEPQTPHQQRTYHLAKKVLKRNKLYGWQLLENPNQLRIQTIDSLCVYLTKQLPILANFGSTPEISTQPFTLYEEAVNEILMHVEEEYEWSEAIAHLLEHLDNDLNKVAKLLINLLAKRDQWLPLIHLNFSDAAIKNELEKHLENILIDSLSRVAELFPKPMLNELLEIARFAASNAPIDSELKTVFYDRMHDIPDASPKSLSLWLSLISLLFTKSFNYRKQFNKDIGFLALNQIKNSQEKETNQYYRQRLKQLIETLSEHNSLTQALIELYYLPPCKFNESQWKILKSLLQLLKIVAAQLRVIFQQQGQIDYIENAQAALLALGSDDNPTNLALALDYQIKHLLVDEFQDTSSTQYQLLYKLTAGWVENDGRTLFVVGDPMQSIYRFREAEVGLFIRMFQHGIGQIKLNPLVLSINFRSNPTIVNWNNHVFRDIFPKFNDIASGAVSYSDSTTLHVDDGDLNKIAVLGCIESSSEILSKKTIEYVQNIKSTYPNESIAILVRSRSHLNSIIPTLRKAKIAFQAIDIERLSAQQAIQDLLSLTIGLLHPGDRIAWLSILRAPWCGLSLADLTIIVDDSPRALIINQLTRQDLITKLSAHGQKRLKEIYPILIQSIHSRERYALSTLIENTWILLGGPATLEDDSQFESVNAFFDLLEKCKNSSIDDLKKQVTALYASSQNQSTLQIMTIHTAKGLEFDTVIIPHLEKKMPQDDKNLLSWMEQPLTNGLNALLLAPLHATGTEKDPIYEYIARRQKLKANYEIDRLLYVATTRAKKRLCLIFNAEENDKGELKVEPGSFLQKLSPHLQNYQKISDETHATTLQDDNEQRFVTRFISEWQNPITSQSFDTISYHKKIQGFKIQKPHAKIVGTLMHLILKQLTDFGIPWWETKSKDQQTKYIYHHLNQFGLSKYYLNEGTAKIFKMIDNILNDDRGKWILHPHSDAKSEFALTTVLENETNQLIIDRTFIDENQIRWIIDYKTRAFNSDEIDKTLNDEKEKYLQKMNQYAAALKKIDKNIKIKLGLYFPAGPYWHEWEA